jgi:ATP-dependent Lhr-like helicase
VLRSARNAEKTGRLTVVNGADPLNLVGVLLPGAKVPALHGNRVLYRDGVAVAALVAGEVRHFEQVAPEKAWEMNNLLLRTAAPAQLAALME